MGVFSSFRMGFRLMQAGGKRVWFTRLLFALGICLTVVSVLICVAAATVPHAQDLRTRERSLAMVDDEGTEPLGYFSEQSLPFEDRLLLRIDVDVEDKTLRLPAGLERWPEVGEVILSPAASELFEPGSDF